MHTSILTRFYILNEFYFRKNCNIFMKIDLKDHYWEAAEILQRENNYPYEMMPLLYAIVKSTQGNSNEAQKLIHEGRIELQIFRPDQTARSKTSGSVSPLTNNTGNRILDLTLKKISNYRKEPSKRNLSKNQLHRPWKQEYKSRPRKEEFRSKFLLISNGTLCKCMIRNSCSSIYIT